LIAAPRGGYAWFIAKQKREPATPYWGGAVAYRRLTWTTNNTVEWADTTWCAITDTSYRDYFDLNDGAVTAPQSNTTTRIDLGAVGSRLTIGIHPRWRTLDVPPCRPCRHQWHLRPDNDASGTNVDRSAAQWLKLSTDTNGNFVSITSGARL